MEGIAAFGLACNVIQIVGVASKTTTLVYQAYKHGGLPDNTELEQTSETLSRLTTSLSANSRASANPTDAEKELQSLATQCHTTVQTIQSELNKLKSRGGKRDAILKSFKSIQKRSDIKKLQDKLSGYQSLLNTGILVRLSEQNDAFKQTQQDTFLLLDQSLQDFIQDLAKDQKHTINEIASTSAATRKVVVAEHAQTRALLQPQIESQNSAKLRARSREQLLMSLRYENMYARMNKISDAAHETFEWILQDAAEDRRAAELDPDPRIREFWRFADWLDSPDHIFWIQGKAGSGKSTLMKFLSEHPTTKLYLERANTQKPVMVVSHFFWLAGSPNQWDLKGFLTSILYQILNDSQETLDHLLRENPSLGRLQSVSDWSEERLMLVTVQALKHSVLDAPCCIFIDGVDEFGENEAFDALIKFIGELQQIARTKLVISSRPEIRIVKAFQDLPTIRLQDLTLADIRQFTEKEIQKAIKGMSSKLEQTEHHALVNSIADKADGVFLWVKLALQDIFRGIISEDAYEELLKRTTRLPRGLNQLYQNMLERLGDDWELYQKEAAFYLRMTYLASQFDLGHLPPEIFSKSETSVLSVLSMTLAYQQSVHSLPVQIQEVTDIYPLIDQCRRISLRIISCCGGMLEVDYDANNPVWDFGFGIGTFCYMNYARPRFTTAEEHRRSRFPPWRPPEWEPYCQLSKFQGSSISFTHRTVLDFLETGTGREILKRSDIGEKLVIRSHLQAVLIHVLTCGEIFSVVFWRLVAEEIEYLIRRIDSQSDFVCEMIKMLAFAFTEMSIRDTSAMSLAEQRQLEYDILKTKRGEFSATEFTSFTEMLLSCGLYECIAQDGDTASIGNILPVTRFTHDYLNVLLYNAMKHPRSARRLHQALVSAGADINAVIWLPIDDTIRTTPWHELINMTQCQPDTEELLPICASFLQHEARLDEEVLATTVVWRTSDHFALPPIRPPMLFTSWNSALSWCLFYSGDHWKKCFWSGILIVSKIQVQIAISKIAPKLFREEERLEHATLNEQLAKFQPLALIRPAHHAAEAEGRDTEVHWNTLKSEVRIVMLSPTDSSYVFDLIGRNFKELADWNQWSMQVQMAESEDADVGSNKISDSAYSEIEDIFEKGEKLDWKEFMTWLQHEGWCLPPDHPSIIRGPTQRFKDRADEDRIRLVGDI